MGQPSFFDNVREWIGGIAFSIYLWSVKMSDEEFWNEQERQAAQHLLALDGLYCQFCGELLSEHLITEKGGHCEPAHH